MAMKLTGGTASGTNLFTVKGRDTRPAQARVRNSLFNILQGAFDGARVLDLYAGTGAVGLEALSRGAASCLFVDQDRDCADVIRKNLEKLRWLDRGRVVRASVHQVDHYLPDPKEAHDFIFIDPPYAVYRDPKARPALAATVLRLIERGHLAPDGRMIFENSTEEGFTDAELPGLTCEDRRRYHQTELSFFRRTSSQNENHK